MELYQGMFNSVLIFFLFPTPQDLSGVTSEGAQGSRHLR